MFLSAFLSRSSSHKPLIMAGLAGLLLWFLVPTISRAFDVSDQGALANGLFLVQTALGFAGVIALIAGVRAWQSTRRRPLA